MSVDAPRGNGVNVHLKSGTTVFVQENHREAIQEWIEARRHPERGTVVKLTGREGRSVSLPPENIDWMESL